MRGRATHERKTMDLDKLFEKVPYDRIIPLPAWQRFAAVGGVALVIVAAFYFLVIKGKDREIVKLNEDLAKIQKEVEDNKRYAAKMSKLKDRIAKLEVELTEASKQLPSEKEIPELLEQVSNIGTQSGLEFVTFKPRGEQRQEYYSEVPVTLKIIGKFHNMLMFFDEIAHLPRIVTINNIRMASGDPKAGVTNLKVDCTAITYRFVERTEEPGATGKNQEKGKNK